MAKANSMDLKVITVDDQFVNAKGQAHGASAPGDDGRHQDWRASGVRSSTRRCKARQWDVKATGVLAITADELDTARRRVERLPGALKAASFPAAQIFSAPPRATTFRGRWMPPTPCWCSTRVKNWLIVGMNDNTVLGGVRATEGQGFKAENVIGIGISRVDAVNELSSPAPLASSAPCCPARTYTATEHQMLHDWVVNGAEACQVHRGDRRGTHHPRQLQVELQKGL